MKPGRVHKATMPDWLDPRAWLDTAAHTTPEEVRQALCAVHPGIRQFAALISPASDAFLEPMAAKAQALTRRHFGRTISMYVPLYLSNYCRGGCSYCGFASDRKQLRRRLEPPQILEELQALKRQGFHDVLLLTGERDPKAGFDYVRDAVTLAAKEFDHVAVEAFAMTPEEYGELARAGCSAVTLYQETYDPALYERVHRWGPKKHFASRLEAPERALQSGIRSFGIGALLGLGEPLFDVIALYQHAMHLQKVCWRAGIILSFPRLRPEPGGYAGAHRVTDRELARFIFALRICMPETPLVLSTREAATFRDGMAGIGITRMSAASRTTVGGYTGTKARGTGQFEISDARDVGTFCAALRQRELEPVFKNWDHTLQ
jgi:2-iminoacetate synthase